MNWSFWIIIFVIFFVIFPRGNAQKITAAKIISSKRKGVSPEMKELAKRFIDKECLIYTIGGSTITIGFIKEITDSAILVESVDDSNTSEVINLEFVTRIREYPRKKNGKKALVFD